VTYQSIGRGYFLLSAAIVTAMYVVYLWWQFYARRQSAIDTYAKAAFAKPYDRKTPLTTADVTAYPRLTNSVRSNPNLYTLADSGH
jgi:hypothetical protein